MLGLFWEHPPALDPEDVGRRIQFLRDRIRNLENQKRALLEEEFLTRNELEVRDALIGKRLSLDLTFPIGFDCGGQTRQRLSLNMGLRLRLEWNCSVDRSRFTSAHLRDFFVPGLELCGAIKKWDLLGFHLYCLRLGH
ncbi:hypothetical protein Tco_1067691 [Tanacetum coccineum]|uniref:Uncharacterized protein n=1 Tax=Tanacetum coccineum TaxID=301880 RepID=A0ABQ5HDL3_9ASTR